MTKDGKRVVVKARGLSKTFILPHERQAGIKQLIINGLRGKYKKGYEKQHVLRDVSFEIYEGDFFGIVGRNGSGKSTLLKILSGIYRPDKGSLEIHGSLVPFIELGVGFNPELTGRENIFLNGALLGFDRDQVEAMYEDIVTFAELEKFMDQKLKNYSSGMQVRLAFSIAIRAKTDLLILDEVLAVGDEAFQRKCYQYFAEVKKRKQTVILVTHDMDTVLQFCNRAMLIDKGHETEIGSPTKIAKIYRELNNPDENAITVNKAVNGKTATKYITADVTALSDEDTVVFEMKLESKLAVEDPIIALGIYKDDGQQIYRWVSDEKVSKVIDISKPMNIRIELENVFPVGVFTASLFIKKLDRTVEYATFNDIVTFEIQNSSLYSHDTFWKVPERTLVNGEEV